MAESMSALNGKYNRGQMGDSGIVGVTLEEVATFSLMQVSAWPGSLAQAKAVVASMAGATHAPTAGQFVQGSETKLLRVEPLKWWLVSDHHFNEPEIHIDAGVALDLSHARSWIKVSGDKADVLLNHFLPLDLRPKLFADGIVANTAFHHVGVTLWRDGDTFNLLLPRSFAVALWEQLCGSSMQYGLKVV